MGTKYQPTNKDRKATERFLRKQQAGLSRAGKSAAGQASTGAGAKPARRRGPAR